MPAPSVLLLECLSGLGAHEADAALRVRALRHAGCAARAVVVDPGPAPERAATLAQAIAPVAAERPAAVWVAASASDWRWIDRALPAGLPRSWWPCVLPGSGGEPDPDSNLAASAIAVTPPPRHLALELAPVRIARERAPVALWDGDFILAPGPLKGAEGRRLLRAYAAAIESRPELDLVILADPDPEVHAFAQSLGIGWRVHSAGESPREAEHTWLGTAAAVLLPVAQPVSAGLILRMLAAGAPVIIDPLGPAARGLTAWLGDALPGFASPAAALEAVLSRDPRVRDACALGRVRAARQEPEPLGARLSLALGGEEGRRRAAA